jgi:hypothetical protein
MKIGFLFILIFPFVCIQNIYGDDNSVPPEILTIDDLYFSIDANYTGINHDSLINTSNILNIEEFEFSPSAVFAFHFKNFYSESKIVNNYMKVDIETPLIFTVNEAYLNFPVGESLFFYIGKKRLNWDSTPFSRPLDYFDTNRLSSNLYDNPVPDEGRLGLISNFSYRIFDLSAAFFDDRWSKVDNYNYRGGLHSGLRIRMFFNEINISIAGNIMYIDDKYLLPSMGYLFDIVVIDSIKLYSSANFRRGSMRVFSRTAFDDVPKIYSSSPYEQWNIDSDKIFPEVNIGIQFNPNFSNTLFLSYIMDANKYNDIEWNNFISSVNFHHEMIETLKNELVYANIMWDGIIAKEIFLRQHHFALHWRFQYSFLETNMTCFMSIEDASILGKLNIKLDLDREFDLSANFTCFLGKENTEFGIFPTKYLLGFTATYYLK